MGGRGVWVWNSVLAGRGSAVWVEIQIKWIRETRREDVTPEKKATGIPM